VQSLLVLGKKSCGIRYFSC